MSSRAAPKAPTSPPATAEPRRWLFGPVTDLALGCGVAYLPLFALLALAGEQVRAIASFELLTLSALLVLSFPHYGATLLRVYEQRDDRRAYALFGVGATLVIAALFVTSLWVVPLGAALFTIYLTWSPWHYMGQNYGVALMFLRRREVEVAPRTKRLLYASFVLSFVLAFLALNSIDNETSYAPNDLTGNDYGFYSLDFPAWVLDWGIGATGAVYVLVTLAALALIKSKARWRDLIPPVLLILTQALWFAAPAFLRHFDAANWIEPLSGQHAAYAFIFIAMGHAAQYLWITAYYARGSGRSRSNAMFYGKAALAGIALWTIPALIFAPGVLGNRPYEAGLFVVLASAINIHHFILDGAIWKLRKGTVARVLLLRRDKDDGKSAPDEPAAASRPRRRWAWPTVAALGIGSVAVCVFALVETVWGYEGHLVEAANRMELRRASTALERLSWVGRDSNERYSRLAEAALLRYENATLDEGTSPLAPIPDPADLDFAADVLRRSIELKPTHLAWMRLGDIRARQERWEPARDAYLQAQTILPDEPATLFHLGVVWLRLRKFDKARRLLLTASKLVDADPDPSPQTLELRSHLDQVLSQNRHVLGIGQ